MLRLIAEWYDDSNEYLRKAIAISKIESVEKSINNSVVINGDIILDFPNYDEFEIDEVINTIRNSEKDNIKLYYFNYKDGRCGITTTSIGYYSTSDSYNWISYNVCNDTIDVDIKYNGIYKKTSFELANDKKFNELAAEELFNTLIDTIQYTDATII